MVAGGGDVGSAAEAPVELRHMKHQQYPQIEEAAAIEEAPEAIEAGEEAAAKEQLA